MAAAAEEGKEESQTSARRRCDGLLTGGICPSALAVGLVWAGNTRGGASGRNCKESARRLPLSRLCVMIDRASFPAICNIKNVFFCIAYLMIFAYFLFICHHIAQSILNDLQYLRHIRVSILIDHQYLEFLDICTTCRLSVL